MKLLKQLKWNLILLAVLFIALGVVLIVWPSATMTSICYILATILVLLGVVFLIGYLRKDVIGIIYRCDLVIGLSLILAGVLVYIKVDKLTGPGAGGAGISDHHQRYLETAKFRRPSAAGTRNLACGICTGYH